MQELRSIVLASASPRRLEILRMLGLMVRVVPSAIDEGDLPGYGPRELAARYAGEKADVVAAREPAAVIVAADTVVDLDGVAFGKPVDTADAARMLGLLAGRDHVVHTAYVAIDTVTKKRIAATRSTQVTFASFSAGEIAAYVASGEPMDKAGAYGIAGRGAALVARIDGDFYTVMGFPLGDFIRRLPELGYRLGNAPA